MKIVGDMFLKVTQSVNKSFKNSQNFMTQHRRLIVGLLDKHHLYGLYLPKIIGYATFYAYQRVRHRKSLILREGFARTSFLLIFKHSVHIFCCLECEFTIS